MLKKISLLTTTYLLAGILFSATVFSVNLKEHVDTLVNKSTAFSKQGQTALALSMINKAVRLQPENLDLIYKRAFIYGRAGQYVQAVNDFNKVMSRSKRFGHAVRFRAEAFWGAGRVQYAVRDYRSFLKFAPRDGKVWSYLVEALVFAGDRKGALKAANKGLATGSHWSKRLALLKSQILAGQQVERHKLFSN